MSRRGLVAGRRGGVIRRRLANPGLLAFLVALSCVALPAARVDAANIAVGGTAQVANTQGLGLRLREQPSLNARVVATVPDGTRVSVSRGPVQQEGHAWWQVSTPQGSGWAAANWLVAVEAPTPPDPQLLQQVQQLRANWQQLTGQVNQAPFLADADRTKMRQDLQRIDPLLQAAQAAAQRGDRGTAQARLGEAQQALTALSQRLTQLAQQPDPQLLQQVQQLRATWQQLTARVNQLSGPERSVVTQDLQRIDQLLRAAEAAVQQRDRGAAQARLGEVQQALAALSQRLTQLVLPSGRIMNVEARPAADGVTLSARVQHTGPLYLGCSFRAAGRIIDLPAVPLSGSGEKAVESCVLRFAEAGLKPPPVGQPPLVVEATLALWRGQAGGQMQGEVHRWGWSAVARLDPSTLSARVLGVEPRPDANAIGLVVHLQHSTPVYVACEFRVGRQSVSRSPQRIDGSGEKRLSACAVAYQELEAQRPAPGQPPLAISANVVLLQGPQGGELHRWQGQVGQMTAKAESAPAGRIVNVEARPGPQGVALVARVQHSGPLYLGCSYRVAGREIHRPAVPLSGSGEKTLEPCALRYEDAGLKPPAVGQPPLVVEATLALWREQAGGQMRGEVHRWNWHAVARIDPAPATTSARVLGVEPRPDANAIRLVVHLQHGAPVYLACEFHAGRQSVSRAPQRVDGAGEKRLAACAVAYQEVDAQRPSAGQPPLPISANVVLLQGPQGGELHRWQGQVGQLIAKTEPPSPPAAGRIANVEVRPAAPGVALVARVQHAGPLYLGCSYRVAGREIDRPAVRLEGSGEKIVQACALQYEAAGLKPPAAGQPPLVVEATLALWREQAGGQMRGEVHRWGWQEVSRMPSSLNQPPVARIDITSGSLRTQDGQELRITVPRGTKASVAFSAARSTDPDGRISSYQWEFEGKVQSAERDLSRSLPPGTYAVALSVRDDQGGQGSARATVVITEQPPETASACPPFPAVAGNPFEPRFRGYCTWYAADRWLRSGLSPLPSTRDAAHWLDDAKGYQTGPTPVPGSLMVLGATADNAAGHVAYVEAVDSSGRTFTVSEMNWGRLVDRENVKTTGFCKVTTRTLTVGQVSSLVGFIYPGKPQIVQPPVAQVPVVRFATQPPPRVLLATPTQFAWEGSASGLEYRYKLDVPGDWKAGLRYILNKWTPWGPTRAITYSDFIVAGNYTFSIQARDPRTGRESKEVSHPFAVYFEMPELFEEAVQIDWEKARRARTRKEQYQVLAQEFQAAHSAWLKASDYHRRVSQYQVPPGWFQEWVERKVAQDVAVLLLEQTGWVIPPVKVVLHAQDLYELLKVAGVGLIKVFRDQQANRAASMAFRTYHAWKGYERLAQMTPPTAPPYTSGIVAQKPQAEPPGKGWWGKRLEEFRGVPAFSRGECTGNPDVTSPNPKNQKPMKCAEDPERQCVDYVRRFYWDIHDINDINQSWGSAWQFWNRPDSTFSRLVRFHNGKGEKPQPGDVLFFREKYANQGGHVAIVTEVGADFVRVIHQNVRYDTAIARLSLTGTSVGDVAGMPAVGWLRVKSATATGPPRLAVPPGQTPPPAITQTPPVLPRPSTSGSGVSSSGAPPSDPPSTAPPAPPEGSVVSGTMTPPPVETPPPPVVADAPQVAPPPSRVPLQPIQPPTITFEFPPPAPAPAPVIARPPIPLPGESAPVGSSPPPPLTDAPPTPPANLAPVARIDAMAGGRQAQEGQELRVSTSPGTEAQIVLSGSRSDVGSGGITQYIWEIGTRILGTGAELKRPFRAGTHTVTLTVIDAQGARVQAQVRIVVVEGGASNLSPIRPATPVPALTGQPASLRIDASALGLSAKDGETLLLLKVPRGVPVEVTFSAARSTPPVGRVWQYRWEIPGGREKREGPVVRTPLEPGSHSVLLTGIEASPIAGSTPMALPVTTAVAAIAVNVEWPKELSFACPGRLGRSCHPLGGLGFIRDLGEKLLTNSQIEQDDRAIRITARASVGAIKHDYCCERERQGEREGYFCQGRETPNSACFLEWTQAVADLLTIVHSPPGVLPAWRETWTYRGGDAVLSTRQGKAPSGTIVGRLNPEADKPYCASGNLVAQRVGYRYRTEIFFGQDLQRVREWLQRATGEAAIEEGRQERALAVCR